MAKDLITVSMLPKVSVLDRRLLHPFGAPSVPITLKTPGQWAIRIADSTMRTGRIHDLTANKGWTFVTADELDGTPADLGFRVLDTRLVRGEHGQEVLMKMPQADYERIQQAKGALNLKALGSKQTRERVAQETSQQFGDEAGETVHQHIKVVDGRESIELEPDPVT